MSDSEQNRVAVNLSAVIVSIAEDEPKVLILPGKREGENPSLPSGEFFPVEHRTLEQGLRSWVKTQTGLDLGYVEQLYTFGNRFRSHDLEEKGTRLLSICYIALTGAGKIPPGFEATWMSWYDFLPWEDHRKGRPLILENVCSALAAWVSEGVTPEEEEERQYRIDFAFGREGWDPEKVLFRFELLYEAALLEEAVRDWGFWGDDERKELPISRKNLSGPFPGSPASFGMVRDHRRILASAVGRLRGKIKYRPIVFELLPKSFSLFQIQRIVEALSGVPLHKQNFRRILLSGGLVEDTGEIDRSNPGRPAALYCFRRGRL
ncbi:MAG: hypothetical protein KAU17_08205 [Spirochaetales bacterium]|nr:hypothetical protein [Spirochaetales bacterium]